MYKDRFDAGKELVKYLNKYFGQDVLLLAIPRGGVPIAFIIAEELNFKVDLLLTKKIGHPLHKEYAIGAVSLEESFVIPHPNVPENYIHIETENIRRQLKGMYQKFMGIKKPGTINNKIVIVIDDGIATGNTLRASINMLKKHLPLKIVIAVPVAPLAAIELLLPEVDEIICPLVPSEFRAVGQHYENFSQVSDAQVTALLEKLKTDDLIAQ